MLFPLPGMLSLYILTRLTAYYPLLCLKVTCSGESSPKLYLMQLPSGSLSLFYPLSGAPVLIYNELHVNRIFPLECQLQISQLAWHLLLYLSAWDSLRCLVCAQ